MISSITIPVAPMSADAFASSSPEFQREIQSLVEFRILMQQRTVRREERRRQIAGRKRLELNLPADAAVEVTEDELRQDAQRALAESMDRLSAEAARNGLTEEILQEILRDE